MGVRIIILVGLSLLTSLVIGLFVTYLTIKVLKMKNAGQNIRDEGPESHKQKAGTPSMGGIAIIVTTFITIFIYSGFTKTSIGILLSGIMFGAVGFLDDILKIRKAHNEGLTKVFASDNNRAWTFHILCGMSGFSYGSIPSDFKDHGKLKRVFHTVCNVYFCGYGKCRKSYRRA